MTNQILLCTTNSINGDNILIQSEILIISHKNNKIIELLEENFLVLQISNTNIHKI